MSSIVHSIMISMKWHNDQNESDWGVGQQWWPEPHLDWQWCRYKRVQFWCEQLEPIWVQSEQLELILVQFCWEQFEPGIRIFSTFPHSLCSPPCQLPCTHMFQVGTFYLVTEKNVIWFCHYLATWSWQTLQFSTIVTKHAGGGEQVTISGSALATSSYPPPFCRVLGDLNIVLHDKFITNKSKTITDWPTNPVTDRAIPSKQGCSLSDDHWSVINDHMMMVILEKTIFILYREPPFWHAMPWHLGLALTNLCLAIYVCYTARSHPSS